MFKSATTNCAHPFSKQNPLYFCCSATVRTRAVYRLYNYNEEDDHFVDITDYAKLSPDKKSYIKKNLKSKKDSRPVIDCDEMAIDNTVYVKTTYISADSDGRVQKRFCEVLLAPEKFKVMR